MTRMLVAGIETGGTKILARLCDAETGESVVDGKWATGSADDAAEDLLEFLTAAIPDGGRLAAIGMAAFGPLIVDDSSPDYGQVQATTKPGWTNSNLRQALEERFDGRHCRAGARRR